MKLFAYILACFSEPIWISSNNNDLSDIQQKDLEFLKTQMKGKGIKINWIYFWSWSSNSCIPSAVIIYNLKLAPEGWISSLINPRDFNWSR